MKSEFWVKDSQLHNQALSRVNARLKWLVECLENSLTNSIALLKTEKWFNYQVNETLQIITLKKGICVIRQFSIWMLGDGKLFCVSIKADTRSWQLWNMYLNYWSKQSRSCWSDGGLCGGHIQKRVGGFSAQLQHWVITTDANQEGLEWSEDNTRQQLEIKCCPLM